MITSAKNISKDRGNLKVLMHFFIPYAVLLAGFLAIGLYAYERTSTLVENQTKETAYAVMAQTKEILDRRFEEIETMSEQTAGVTKARSFQFVNAPFEGTNPIRLIELNKDLFDYPLFNHFILDYFVVYPDNGMIVSPRSMYTLKQFYDLKFRYDGKSFEQWKDELTGRYRFKTFIPGQSATYDGKRHSVVTYLRSFGTKDRQALVLILIDNAQIQSLLRKLDADEGGFAFIMDEQGQIVSQQGNVGSTDWSKGMKDGFSQIDIDGRRMLVTRTTSEYNDWTYYSAQPEDAVLAKVQYFKQLIQTIIVLGLAVEPAGVRSDRYLRVQGRAHFASAQLLVCGCYRLVQGGNRLRAARRREQRRQKTRPGKLMVGGARDMSKVNIKESGSDRLFNIMNYIMLTIVLIVVAYPLIYVVSASFSSTHAVLSGRVWLWPVEPTLDGYKAIFKNDNVVKGFVNTVFYTGVGTILNVLLTVMAAYPLSRRDFRGRAGFMLMFVFTMMFNGGLIPTYLLVKELNMIDTVWAMFIPTALSVWNVIIMRTYFQTTIPHELLEASQLDGCNDFRFLTRIVMPLSGPILAVIGLFYAVGHWNQYFNAMIFLKNPDLYPLQLILRDILVQNEVNIEMLGDAKTAAARQGLRELLKYSLIVVSSLPLLAVYPFVQKFFVKGVMIGSVKG